MYICMYVYIYIYMRFLAPDFSLPYFPTTCHTMVQDGESGMPHPTSGSKGGPHHSVGRPGVPPCRVWQRMGRAVNANPGLIKP